MGELMSGENKLGRGGGLGLSFKELLPFSSQVEGQEQEKQLKSPCHRDEGNQENVAPLDC